MRLTMPQILMLNHAAWVNSKRSKIRSQRDVSQNNSASMSDEEEVFNGKPVSELSSDEMAAYMGMTPLG